MKELMKIVYVGIICSTTLFGCDVDVEDPGRAPDVDVDMNLPDVDVNKKKVTIKVPDVDVRMVEKEVTVPDIDVDFNNEEPDADERYEE